MRRIWRHSLVLAGLALWTAAAPQGSAQPQKGAACTAPAVPAYALEYLKQHYPDWRIKQPSDFRPASDPSSGLQNYLWFRHRRCPGIAAGKLQPGPEITYAFLLIPAKKTVMGFPFGCSNSGCEGDGPVTGPSFERTGERGFAEPGLADPRGDSGRLRRAPRSSVRYEIKEGILMAGARSYLFAWINGRYDHGFMDEVDRDQ